ncbi:MAG: extensin family protein [Myxococcales bacterium]|nr:extensin family protein [Myxococcales bacterium]
MLCTACAAPVRPDLFPVVSRAQEELSIAVLASSEAAEPEEKPPPTSEQIFPATLGQARFAVSRADEDALSVDGVDCVYWLRARGVDFEVVTDFTPERPRRARASCTIEQPVRLSGQIGGVTYDVDDMLMSCSLARGMVELSSRLEDYGIVSVDIGTPYSCRTIRGRRTLSQHAHGTALDVASFTDSEGRVYDLEEHWERRTDSPVTKEGRLWRALVSELFEGGVFNIILTPDYDADHENWLHLDLTPGQSFMR